MVRASAWLSMLKFWVRSQHPPTQWNLRGADEAVLNKLLKKEKIRKVPLKKSIYLHFLQKVENPALLANELSRFN